MYKISIYIVQISFRNHRKYKLYINVLTQGYTIPRYKNQLKYDYNGFSLINAPYDELELKQIIHMHKFKIEIHYSYNKYKCIKYESICKMYDICIYNMPELLVKYPMHNDIIRIYIDKGYYRLRLESEIRMY